MGHLTRLLCALMSFDTKYRPLTFADVLGQEGTIQVLRSFVHKGIGFQQSYLFAGPYGSGKTTLGRILARALLCENPVEGNPCDACKSCVEILKGESINFIEVDAATNSGKDQIRKILEELQYATFSGKRRIYLFDESHQLSKDALDAMLKPMEDCLSGSEDKLLVCIFCTTEPEKMRTTILSRCAPSFLIRHMSSDLIAQRLEFVCKAEGLDYDPEVLPLIAEITELHIRDALKAVEGVSMLGAVNRENTNTYLCLDANAHFVTLMKSLKEDLAGSFRVLSELSQVMSPVACYTKLIELCMSAYRFWIGAETNSIHWENQALVDLGGVYQHRLVDFAQHLSSRPSRPTFSMLQCDVAYLHKLIFASILTNPEPQTRILPSDPVLLSTVEIGEEPKTIDGIWIHPKGVNRNLTSGSTSLALPPLVFLKNLKTRLDVLERRSGQKG